MPVRVLVVDDHAMVRQGLQMYFEDDPDIAIIGEARNGEEAVALAPELCPDVILMDLLMPALDGAQATAALRLALPGTHIIAMTSVVEEGGVHRAIEAGAISYILKDTRPDELRELVLAVADGRVHLPADSAGRLLRYAVTPDTDPAVLSEEERDLLRLLAEGCSTAEIAEHAHCSPQQAEQRLDAAFKHACVNGRAHAVLYATRKGLVPATLRPYLE